MSVDQTHGLRRLLLVNVVSILTYLNILCIQLMVNKIKSRYYPQIQKMKTPIQ